MGWEALPDVHLREPPQQIWCVYAKQIVYGCMFEEDIGTESLTSQFRKKKWGGLVSHDHSQMACEI